MVAEISVKRYKIFNLKNEYRKLSILHHKLQLHINMIYQHNILNNHDYTRIINDMNDFIKKTNTEYNKYVTNIDQENDDDNEDDTLSDQDDTSLQHTDLIDKASLLHFVQDLNTQTEEDLFKNIQSFI